MTEERKLSEDSNAVKGRLGEREACRILEKEGFTNVRRRDKEEKGFDLKADKEGKTLTFEVKSTTGEFSIPDAYGSEFDLTNQDHPNLIADYLLVVRISKQEDGLYRVNGAHLLPRDFVNTFQHRIKTGVVLSRDLQNILKKSNNYWVNYNA